MLARRDEATRHLRQRNWSGLLNRVSEWRPDVVVEIARRTPRLAECLGVEYPSGTLVMTDLAIPLSGPFIRGARVAVIDDVCNVGSTLANAQATVERLGAKRVKCFVLNHLEGVAQQIPEGSVALSRHEAKILADEVPRALSLLPKPYDFDFPIVPCRLEMPASTASDLSRLLIQEFGSERVFNQTSSDAAACGQHRFTVDWPGDHVLGKLRYYLDLLTGTVNVVPMQLPAELSTDRSSLPHVDWVLEFWDMMVESAQLSERDGEARARLHLFLNSLLFGLSVLRQHPWIQMSQPFGVEDAQMSLGPFVRRGFVDIDDVPEYPSVAEQPKIASSPFFETVWPALRHEVVETRYDNDALSTFDALFDVLADAAGALDSRQFRLPGPVSVDDVQANPYTRLRIGPTFGDLVAILAETCKPNDSRRDFRQLVSRLLDVYVDSGGVVPTIGSWGSTFYRIYRKGETDERSAAACKVCLGLSEYGSPMSLTRMAKVAAILAFSEPPDALTQVTADERGNVLTFARDVLDGDAEISHYLLRAGYLTRPSRA